MWNTIAANRLLDRKRKKEAQLRHISALKNVKPSLDNRCPPSYSFLETRPKARLLKRGSYKLTFRKAVTNLRVK